MNRIFSLLALLLLMLACAKQKADTPSSSCEISPEVAQRYQADAIRLLYREIVRDSVNHPGFQQARFDSARVQELLKAFQAVYQLNHPARDSVVNKHQIHAFPWLSLNSISLEVNPQAPEIRKLIRQQPTGNPILDSLVSYYGFTQVDSSSNYPRFPWLTLFTEQRLNLQALLAPLEKLPYVFIAEPNGACCDGNNITLNRLGPNVQLDFSIGWGDCPAGCIYRKHWVFEVDPQCHARFVKSY